MNSVKVGLKHISFSVAGSLLTFRTRGLKEGFNVQAPGFRYYFNQIMMEQEMTYVTGYLVLSDVAIGFHRQQGWGQGEGREVLSA